ncbi:MAG: Omp28-related outer membrane protein [Crocinitomicaceae bacterium]|nr:Omp28-related outer membrane protein [Crocinitomicaceae bacterium]
MRKNVVLEEYTGIYCGYCPDGHKKGKEFAEDYPGDVMLINIHTGSYASPSGSDPDYRTTHGSSLAGQASIGVYPAGTINRRVFSGYEQAGGTAMSRSYWQPMGETVLTEDSYVNVAADAIIDPTTRELTVNFEAYFTASGAPSSMKYHVAVLQSNIKGPQNGGSTFYPAEVNPDGTYNHHHMLRKLITGTTGNSISTTTVGTLVEESETWTIPDDLNGVDLVLEDLEVVVFVSETNQNIITGAKAHTGFLGVNEFASELEFGLSVFPNPVVDIVNVRLDLKQDAQVNIEVLNLVGEVVSNNGAESMTIGTNLTSVDVANLPKGIYFVRATINDAVEVRKITVQ